MTNRDAQYVIDAIDRYRAANNPPKVFFGDRIPQDTLDNAIATFAQLAAEEKALLLVPATSSGKAGFLFTDQALYFGEALGSEPMRMPWDEITAVRRERKWLQIESRNCEIKWDLSATLLWERSRSAIADVVAGVLEMVLHDQSASEEVGRAVVVEVAEDATVDWPKVVWFHAPVILIGGCLILPILYLVLANWGAFGDASYRLSAKGSDRMFLGLLSIAPVVYAFGTSLRFSIGRFIGAVVLLGFLQVTVALRSAVLGGAALPISLGGGFVGIVLAYALGHGGLKVRTLLGAASMRRLVWIAGIVIVVSIATLVARDNVRRMQYEAENKARQEAETALRNEYWAALFNTLQEAGSSVDTATKRNALHGQATLYWQLTEQIELSISQWPCVTIAFESGDDRLPYIDQLLADRERVEARLGPDLKWSEPEKQRVYAGGGVSEREVSNLPRYWNNGKVWNCLDAGEDSNSAYKDQADWPRQHAWIADQVDGFVSILMTKASAPRATPTPTERPVVRQASDPLEQQHTDAEMQLAAVTQTCFDLDKAIAGLEARLVSLESELADRAEQMSEVQRMANIEALRADRASLSDVVLDRAECEARRVNLKAHVESLGSE